MNYEEALDALNKHKPVHHNASETDFYIESITATISCGDSSSTNRAWFANLNSGKQANINELHAARKEKEEPTFRTLRHGNHTPLSQIQETIDAYEARMRELKAEIDAVYDWTHKNLTSEPLIALHKCINKAYKEAHKQNAGQDDSPHEVHEEGTTAISEDDCNSLRLSSDALRNYAKYLVWDNDKEFATVNLERIRKAAEEYINKHSENEPVTLNCRIYISK